MEIIRPAAVILDLCMNDEEVRDCWRKASTEIEEASYIFVLILPKRNPHLEVPVLASCSWRRATVLGEHVSSQDQMLLTAENLLLFPGISIAESWTKLEWTTMSLEAKIKVPEIASIEENIRWFCFMISNGKSDPTVNGNKDSSLMLDWMIMIDDKRSPLARLGCLIEWQVVN